MLATILLILAGKTTVAYSQTEWFPIGAKWCYEIWRFQPERGTYFLFTVEKDTVVDGKNCRVIRGENSLDIVYEEEGRIYYYFNGKFRKIYDFNAKVGDTVEFEFKTQSPSSSSLDTTIVLPFRIESIPTKIIDGVELREVRTNFVHDGTKGSVYTQHIYIEKIGVVHPYIISCDGGPFPVMPNLPTTADHVTRLQWYQDHDIEYIGVQGLDSPCDCKPPPANITQKENIPHDVIVFPNPVQEVLTISGEARTVAITIYDVTGRVVLEKKELLPYEINVEHLLSGIYFIRILDEHTQKLITKKFIKL